MIIQLRMFLREKEVKCVNAPICIQRLCFYELAGWSFGHNNSTSYLGKTCTSESLIKSCLLRFPFDILKMCTPGGSKWWLQCLGSCMATWIKLQAPGSWSGVVFAFACLWSVNQQIMMNTVSQNWLGDGVALCQAKLSSLPFTSTQTLITLGTIKLTTRAHYWGLIAQEPLCCAFF